MMRSLSLVAFFLLIGFSFARAQNGVVKGTVSQINGDKKEGIYAVNVVLVSGTGSVLKGVRTDFDGIYQISYAAGTYKLRITATGLKEQLLEIVLKESNIQELDVLLESPVKDHKEVVVVGLRAKTSEMGIVKEIKEDLGAKSSMGTEQIASTGSNDTKDVLSKMSGVSSSQAGGVIFVRGLGDRYNVAYLNGLPLVSPNPELRVMPMDIMPTTIIDVLDVSKMMAPNLYGDFGGGAINIRTKKIFKTAKINFTLGSTSNSQITGKAFTTYAGGKTDYFGFDDGTRALPTEVKNTSMKRADNIFKNGLYNSVDGKGGTGFLNNFNKLSKTAIPGINFRIEGGNYFHSKKEGHGDRGFGFLTMLSNSSSYQQQRGMSRYINAQNKLEYNFDTKSDVYATSTIGLASMLFDISSKSSIHFNYLMINNTEDVTTQSWGYHRDYNDGGLNMYGRRNAFNQNSVNIFQLMGDQKLLNNKLKINWGTSYSLTANNVPDRKQITGLYSDKENTTRYNLLALDANHTHRFFSELKENEVAAHVDFNYNLFSKKTNDTTKSKLDLIVGFDFKNKNRTFNFRQFNYLAKPLADAYANNFDINSPDNYFTDANHDAGLFRIEESANPGNGYEAMQTVFGANIGAVYQINKKIDFIPNLRIENGFQSVINRKQTQANIKEVNIIEGLDLMPSFALKIETKENQMIRLGASKTIIRPKFFEVAPFEYLAQVIGLTQVGNNKLQNATNYNADLRYEIYTPRTADLLIFGVFAKKLVNPIEQILLPAASGQLISFANTNNGTVAGAEVEFAKSLASFLPAEKRKESKLKNYSFSGNLAYIYSKIDVNDATGFSTNSIRPLQGASPVLANIILKYDNKFKRPSGEGEDKKWMKWMSSISYSYASKTLYVVGVQGVGDQYLFPTNHLNFTNRFSFSNDLSITLTFRNLLNNKYRIYQQDMVHAGEWQNVNTFTKGVDFQFSLTYVFKYKKHRSED